MAVETMGTLFVILCAALIARTQRFKTEHAALISGLMIFATLSVLIPLDRGTTTKIRTDLQPTAPGGSQINSGSSVFHLAMANEAISLQQARRQLLIHVSTHEFQSNAKVKVQRYISSCKPSYYGLFGLGSYLNNSLQTCPTDYALPVGAKIQIISHWETWPSRYNYAQVRYRHLGKTQIGWVQAGWKEEPWAFLELKMPEDSIPEWSSST